MLVVHRKLPSGQNQNQNSFLIEAGKSQAGALAFSNNDCRRWIYNRKLIIALHSANEGLLAFIVSGFIRLWSTTSISGVDRVGPPVA
jgi:hypothetical protein